MPVASIKDAQHVSTLYYADVVVAASVLVYEHVLVVKMQQSCTINHMLC